MNLSLKIEGVNIIPVNEGIKYVINSPAFSDKAIAGDYSYPMSFANNPETRKVFEFIDREDSFFEITEKDCEIYLNNNLFVTGKFQITKTTKDVVSGNIINLSNDLINKINETKLTDLTLESISFNNESEKWNWLFDTVNYNYPNRNIVMFPVMNSGQNDKQITEDDGTNYILTIGSMINGMQETDPGVLEFGVPNMIAFPYVPYIIDRIFETYNFKLINNVFANDQELSQLVLLNYLKNNSTQNDLDPPTNTFELKNHIANIKITDFLNYITGLIAHAYFFNFQQNQVEAIMLKDLLIPGNYVDWSDKVVKTKEKEYKHEPRGFFLYQDFNDDIMKDKQSSWERGQNLTADYIVNKPDDLNPNTAVEGEIGYVKADNAWYVFSKLPNKQGDLKWRFLTWNFFGVKTNEGANDRGTKMTTAGMYWYDRTAGRYDSSKQSQTNIWMIPQVGLKIIDSWEAWKLATPDPRVVFWRGIQKAMDDNQGYYTVDYPLGSSGNTDAEGNTIGSLKLQWDGDNGLKKNFWEEWLNIIDDPKTFLFEMNLNILDLLNLDLKKQVKINSNFYLIKKLTLDLPLKNTVKAEMVRI